MEHPQYFHLLSTRIGVWNGSIPARPYRGWSAQVILRKVDVAKFVVLGKIPMG